MNKDKILAIIASIVTLLPLFGVFFNPNIKEHLFVLDLYSGHSIRSTYVIIICIFGVYTLFRMIYSQKKDKMFLVSIINFIANIAHSTFFILGGLIILNKYLGNSLSSQTGALISIAFIPLIINTATLEYELYNNKFTGNNMNTFRNATKSAFTPTFLIHLALTIFLVALSGTSSINIVDLIATMAIIIWNLIYIMFTQRYLVPLILP